MSLVKKNVIANLVGNTWTGLISIAFIPVYIHFLGVESYGLVGFFVTLQAVFVLLDMGLTGTLARELARLSSLKGREQEIRNLVRTLESIYWLIAIIVILVVMALSPIIATKWLNASQLSSDVIQQSVLLMGIAIAFRLPYGFYSGGLLGLQKQVLLNGIKITIETLKSVGAVFVLWAVSSSIVSFFYWQVIVGVLSAAITYTILWRCLPLSEQKAKYQHSNIRKLWRFFAGIGLASSLSTVFVQIDKLVLSKIISLEMFGYYSIASMVASGLYLLVASVFSSMYPRFIQLVTNKQEKELIGVYHMACQLMSILIIPAALIICFFSLDIMNIWIQDADVADNTAPILSMLVIGTAIYGLMSLPYALQLAYGWMRLTVYMYSISILLFVPIIAWAASSYGVLMAASVWIYANTIILVIGTKIMHGRYLKNELVRWYVYDLLSPAIASLLVIVLFKMTMPKGLGEINQVIWITLSYCCSVIMAVVSTPGIRSMVWARIIKHTSNFFP